MNDRDKASSRLQTGKAGGSVTEQLFQLLQRKWSPDTWENLLPSHSHIGKRRGLIKFHCTSYTVVFPLGEQTQGHIHHLECSIKKPHPEKPPLRDNALLIKWWQWLRMTLPNKAHYCHVVLIHVRAFCHCCTSSVLRTWVYYSFFCHQHVAHGENSINASFFNIFIGA